MGRPVSITCAPVLGEKRQWSSAVAAGRLLIHGAPKQLVMALETLQVVRRLKKKLEQIQQYGSVSRLSA
jgi:hypothetical protein